MPSDRVLPLRLLLPVIPVENLAIGCRAGTPALGEISRLGWGGLGELVMRCMCRLNTQSQTVKGIVHTSTNRLEEKENLEHNHSWETDGHDSN